MAAVSGHRAHLPVALTRFKTDLRLWFWISLVLFVVPWFLPIWGGKGADKMMPAVIWLVLVQFPSHLGESLFGICGFTLVFGAPAILVGWIIQCIAVMVSAGVRRRREHGP